MPSTPGINVSSLRTNSRSKKRFDKLLGKDTSKQRVTRSRVSSIDFGTESEYSCISNFQDLKRKKRTRLENLKSNDMTLMSA